ncbi:hypothetical protein [Actinoplanes friuliensis]|jgi:hypothetical protein|uniref:Lipoprotein n=1 Tax=Actinoplanes friuliensis DSM 7358 TaxID=1246995 RepID=U5VSA3_9ACTN|nr:hypothetical protein [Actinoplanes friuliensis]AGZ39687.1 hypothetical protein AFR_06990 [Actinoplanes friuliensis DSM 7358]
MNVSQVRPAVLAALFTVSVAVTGGCGAAADEVVAKPTPLGPRDALLKSLPDFTTGSFRFAVTGEVPASGEFDAGKHSYRIGFRYKQPDAGFTLHSDYLVVEKQTWIKIKFTGTEGLTGLPKLPKRWMLIDPAKVKDKDNVPLGYADETDPGDAGVVLRAVVDAEQTTEGKFTGTTDLTQQGKTEIVAADRLTALGDKAKQVPFEAATDSKGRLTRLVVKIPAAGKHKAGKYEVTYTDFGSAPTPVPPAADQQQKATAGAYELLNS